MTKLTFYGHAAFAVNESNDNFIFDPFLSNNPLSPVKAEDIKANYILVSHAHQDHLGDTEIIAKKNDALIISTNEIAVMLQEKGLNAHNMHIGGSFTFPFGKVKLTSAYHGSGIAGGHACGIILKLNNGKNIYFAGDTSLFGDMKLIGETNDLDIALLPIGDNFTMGIEDAVMATKFLNPKIVIPIHYNTWPPIEVDPKVFKKSVENETSSKCVILNPGDKLTF